LGESAFRLFFFKEGFIFFKKVGYPLTIKNGTQVTKFLEKDD